MWNTNSQQTILIKDVILEDICRMELESMWGLIVCELPDTHDANVKHILRWEEPEINMEVPRIDDQVILYIVFILYEGVVVIPYLILSCKVY